MRLLARRRAAGRRRSRWCGARRPGTPGPPDPAAPRPRRGSAARRRAGRYARRPPRSRAPTQPRGSQGLLGVGAVGAARTATRSAPVARPPRRRPPPSPACGQPAPGRHARTAAPSARAYSASARSATRGQSWAGGWSEVVSPHPLPQRAVRGQPGERRRHRLVVGGEEAVDPVAHELAHARALRRDDRKPRGPRLEGGDAERLEPGRREVDVGRGIPVAQRGARHPPGQAHPALHPVLGEEALHAAPVGSVAEDLEVERHVGRARGRAPDAAPAAWAPVACGRPGASP